LIKDEFVCERRGLILVKGKGEMETWFLRGIAPERAGPPAPAVPLPARPAERVG
jgi:hypothetical protein